MEGDRDRSSSAYYTEGERGAGGKLRKPPARKKQVATPYARPLAINQSTNQRQESGWLSKLVNPAYRLIAGGATKLIPSYFYKSESVSDIPPLITSDHDNGVTDLAEKACKDDKHDEKLGIFSSIDEAGPSNTRDRLKDYSENNDTEEENVREPSYDSEFAKIENLMKGKQFSRDELKRLTEILNSRVVDTSDAQRENVSPSLASWGKAEGALLEHSSPKLSVEMNQKDNNRALLETPTPRVQPNISDEVAASPVDIARAYMGSRCEVGLDSYSIKDVRAQEKTDLFASKLFFPSPSTKSSTCWPGAMVQDPRGYLTPQNERGKYGFQNFPRTPYSRTIHSKSRTKLTELQADSRSLTNSLTPFQQSRTSNYAQLKSRNIVDGGYGSVGPVRRVRNKFASDASPRGSTSLNSVQNTPLRAEKSSPFGGFLPVSGKNLEPSRMSGAPYRGSTTPNYQSAEPISLISEEVPVLPSPSYATARKILEQLDRHKPTPKEKAEELKLATAWKRHSENAGADLGGSGMHNIGNTELKIIVEGNDKIASQKDLLRETDAQNTMTETSSTVADASLGASFGFKNAGYSQIKSTHQNAFTGAKISDEGPSQLKPPNNLTNGQDSARLPPVATCSDSLKRRSSQPTLKPISFKRPDPKQVISSDNGSSSGFTFPFSGPGSLQSEPPTPSILPSFSPPQQEGSIPVYNFGSKKSTQRLVFSFPSTTSSYKEADVSDLKFNFGSDNKSRISFGSVANGALV